MPIHLTVPDTLDDLKPRITVFGVGGAGGNAVNNMIQSNLEGVEFVVANTDAQALLQSKATRRIQMGTVLTQGLGAGSHPHVGASAAQEALPEIIDHLTGSHMVFITAGMGGGTGTGAAPIIAQAAREQGILTVGVVTKPFHFEGQRRIQTAEMGILELGKHVDTILVIPNQNLFRIANQKTTFAEAFSMADRVLYSGVASITELMTKEGLINLDFADVRAIMSEMGKAMMGTGEASGERRAIEAAEAAIANPLLDDVSMRGARGLLISITGGPDLTLYEVDEAATRIREEVDPDANIILGATFDEQMDGFMRVSVVATGLAVQAKEDHPPLPSPSPEPTEEKQASQAPSSAHPSVKPSTTRPPSSPSLSRQESAPQIDHASAPEEEGRAYSAPAHAQDHGPYGYEDDLHGYAGEGEQGSYNEGYFDAVVQAPKMPSIQDFPPLAQRQFAARQAQICDLGGKETSRKGLLDRIAQAFSKKPKPSRPFREGAAFDPSLVRAPAPLAHHDRGYEAPGAPLSVDPNITDEELEIPTFLRRQAR